MPFIQRQEGSIDDGIWEQEQTIEEDKVEEGDPDEIEMIEDGTNQDDMTCRIRFTEWAESYEVDTPHDCNAGIYEEGSLYDDGFRYQTVMVNTCKHKTKKYTIFMEVMDWFRIEHFYTTYDSEENAIKDSIISECHYYEDDDSILACTFELGYIEDYEEYGLSDPWQLRAAF